MNKTKVEPMKAGLETIADAHIASTNEVIGEKSDFHYKMITQYRPASTLLDDIAEVIKEDTQKITDKDVDAKIAALKEIINPEPFKIVDDIDWEQRRYELAKDFVSASIMGCISAGIPWSKIDEITDGIAMADEMIKQLKNE